MNLDIRDEIRHRPMRIAQLTIIAICIVLAMIDGYEVVVVPFTVPHIARAWSLGPVEVGYLLSAGVFGMAIGAVVISPLVDFIGRRRHILACLALITLGMTLSAFSTTLTQLLVWRSFSGLFIGALISSLNIITSEYSSDRRRGVVMGIYGIGFPLGAALGGMLIGPLVRILDWRAPFLFGAALTFLMFIVVLFKLPESISYLVEKRPRNALAAYNRIALRLGYPMSDTLPPIRSQAGEKAGWRQIFSGILLTRTLCLWGGYACLVSAFYFANTWTPKLISDATGDAGKGVTAGIVVLVGGVLGSLVFAGLSLVLRPRLVTASMLCVGAMAFVLYASQIHNVSVAFVLALLIGLCTNGGVAAIFAISPQVYPTVVRGTGVGLMIGFGRGVAILAPLVTGYMLSGGWQPALIYQIFGVLLAFSSIAIVLLDLSYRGRKEDPDIAGEEVIAA